MQMILYFAICHFSCPDLVFKTIPCHLPDGFITEGFALFIILVIFGIITLRAWIQLINLSSRRFLQRLILREMCAYHTMSQHIDQCNHTVSSLKNLTAYATADSDIKGDTMISFDTDSLFWVCDNAASGHICKDKSLFSGDLVPLIYIVRTANGFVTPTLMGNVNLHLRDNEGNKHGFNLTKVNYMPNSPVNQLSLRQLAEQYPNENATPDQNGTGIGSSYDSHMLYWNKKEFSKTFLTSDSCLPKCLFNSGYTQLSMFTLHLAQFYNDRIHWVFASKVKDTDLASDDNGDALLQWILREAFL
jgi:hypothetical protein